MICFALWSLPFQNHHAHNMQSSYYGDYIPIKGFPNFYLFFNSFGEETNKISQFTFGIAIIAFRISIIIKIISQKPLQSQNHNNDYIPINIIYIQLHSAGCSSISCQNLLFNQLSSFQVNCSGSRALHYIYAEESSGECSHCLSFSC